MKVQSKTITVTESVTLSESEAKILKEAQMLVDFIYSALIDVEKIITDSNAERIYDAVTAIGDCLDIIRESAIIVED